MPQRQLTGSRIRERRIERGVRQADLARMAEISPSYLNLIEHNRRRIGGRLLNTLARALGVDPAALASGAEGTLIDGLRSAAAAEPETGADPARAEDFAGRFPGWAALVAAQARRVAALEARVAELTDRLTHDPQLAASLHEVISAVTSIRATSSILVSGADLDRDWQTRFHQNIHADSLKLAESSRSLVDYLEGPGEAGAARSPLEELEGFLDGIDHHVPALEGATPAEPEALVALAGLRGPAATLARDWLARYREDAAALPLGPFSAAARDCGHDPSVLVEAFGADPAAVLRRLATLPRDLRHPPMGLATCDGAGALTYLRQAPGFALPRGGAPCPLWPLFRALAQPGQPVRATVALPGAGAPRFLCHAIAQPRGPQRFDAAPVFVSTMLVMPDPPEDGAPVLPVGVNCRICPRTACAARREPSILTEAD